MPPGIRISRRHSCCAQRPRNEFGRDRIRIAPAPRYAERFAANAESWPRAPRRPRRPGAFDPRPLGELPIQSHRTNAQHRRALVVSRSCQRSRGARRRLVDGLSRLRERGGRHKRCSDPSNGPRTDDSVRGWTHTGHRARKAPRRSTYGVALSDDSTTNKLAGLRPSPTSHTTT